IGEEPVAPYQRPPLSKAYLLGEMSLERLSFKSADYYPEKGVETRFGVAATAIDRAAKTVVMADGARIPYGKLALVTGARANPLPAAMGGDLPGIYAVRDLADVDAMAPEFQAGRRVLVVGGGYIGLEAAAVASKLGLQVTLIERESRILARVASAETADYFRDLHQKHGVEVREGAALEALEPGPDGRVAAARLAGGDRLELDFVIIGVGVTPNDALAAEAGLETRDGVLVDAACRTSDPDILAAGDCARFEYQGASIRLESVQNALDQAQAAAATLAGEETTYAPRPWFWSDQYDVKLQIAGLFKIGAREAKRIVTRPGDRPGGHSVWYFHEPDGAGGASQLWAVDAMNDPRAYMQGKRWIEAGTSPDPAALADAATPLKSLSVSA
ncbi:MAG: FAD-dependent oxidoreductase, partial [Pseudomonadota bacterium]